MSIDTVKRSPFRWVFRQSDTPIDKEKLKEVIEEVHSAIKGGQAIEVTKEDIAHLVRVTTSIDLGLSDRLRNQCAKVALYSAPHPEEILPLLFKDETLDSLFELFWYRKQIRLDENFIQPFLSAPSPTRALSCLTESMLNDDSTFKNLETLNFTHRFFSDFFPMADSPSRIWNLLATAHYAKPNQSLLNSIIEVMVSFRLEKNDREDVNQRFMALNRNLARSRDGIHGAFAQFDWIPSILHLLEYDIGYSSEEVLRSFFEVDKIDERLSVEDKARWRAGLKSHFQRKHDQRRSKLETLFEKSLKADVEPAPGPAMPNPTPQAAAGAEDTKEIQLALATLEVELALLSSEALSNQLTELRRQNISANELNAQINKLSETMAERMRRHKGAIELLKAKFVGL